MSLPDSLSEREKEVAALLLQGLSNKQIAQALSIATRTVEFHTSHIYEKLAVNSRAEAILKLSGAQAEAGLRETASPLRGSDLRETPAVLRVPTVEKERDTNQNDGKIIFSFRRNTMLKILLFVSGLLVVALVALAILGSFVLYPAKQVVNGPIIEEPTSTASPFTPAAIQPNDRHFAFHGVGFELDPEVSVAATGQLVPETANPGDAPFWGIHPAFIHFTMDGYFLTKTSQPAVISVYPVEDYRRLSPQAGEALDNLKTMLAEKPTEFQKAPFLPLMNGVQAFHANVKYLAFQNGSGMRYLTMYAQGPTAVNNADLFYTFQGLSADGRRVVSMIMPVNQASLPADVSKLSSADLEAIAKNPGYYKDQAAKLSAQAETSFSPSLTKLDALAASLLIAQ